MRTRPRNIGEQFTVPDSTDRSRHYPVAMTSRATAAGRIEHFSLKLEFETDPSDVHAAIHAGESLTLVDTRGDVAWSQGRAVGARHLPTREIAARAAAEIPAGTPVVVYCWSPGCNGATKGALEFAKLGYEVREMIGGFEYWAKEGFPVESDEGRIVREPDVLTAPAAGPDCDC
ncbi:rhodanese-related sulfurtransferase [Salinibacterium amurskyense]|uniref:Rhodanese-related sulfurtransferase n=2 Tax=Salinibacterium amurskyense TaxID=205941 RepID=A0A2M9D1I2_9MICO|nr:rhodanese-related sulfurtransferase [Salinibacterium amurskyense]GHD82383.1 sulfurtransferase [Salinibacterium amurskyense]